MPEMKDRLFNKIENAWGGISIAPMPSREELEEFYGQVYYQEQPSATYSGSYSEEELAHRRLRAELLLFALAQAGLDVERHKPKILEIGCGEGFLLQTAKDHGYLIKGIDFSNHGLKIFHPGLLASVEIGDAYEILDRLSIEGERFDVCVMQNIMEHVINPESLLTKAGCILDPNGVATITVPNDFSRIQKKTYGNGDCGP